MEFLTLDSNYQPSKLIERYNSLVWTERYFTTGDFQLVTTDVERMLKLLPLESTVSIRESNVPMIVEAHKIEKKPDGAPQLTTTGRSFESVLERRAAVKVDVAGGPKVAWIEERDKPSDAAYHAIKSIVIDGSFSPNDILSMIDLIEPIDYTTGIANKYEIKPGYLYTTAMELLTTNHRGLKAIRPSQDSNKIGIEIYNGADLTKDVVFDARFDQFENSTYLLSYAGSANWAYVFSSSGNDPINKTILAPEPTGLNRRVLYLDVSSEEGTNSPEARNTRGLIELYKFNATALFDGQISQQVATGYNRDYFLGDIIRLDGEYGLSENVRVSEFIRSDDPSGNKAYPAFEMVAP